MTSSADFGDTRKPTSFCTYPGQVELDRERAYGPNLFGEQLWPVTVDYDPESDKTRVGWSLIPTPAVQVERALQTAAANSRRRALAQPAAVKPKQTKRTTPSAWLKAQREVTQ